MTTRLLNLCGLHLGQTERLLEARPDNPAGFWENVDFVTLADRILASRGAGWDFPPATTIDPNQLLAYAPQAAQCIAGVQAGATDVWGWQDPRSSLLLPFWAAQLDQPRVVVCLRDPIEVAASLSRRNGISQALGLDLWHRYNERLEEDLAVLDLDCIVTHYDTLLAEPKNELRRLTEWLGWDVPDATLHEATASIRPQLRNHERGAESLSPEVRDLYQRLCRRAGPNLPWIESADPTRLEQWIACGERRYTAGDYAAAVEIFRQVLQQDESRARARNNLACALWESGMRDDAVFEAVKALKNAPDDVDSIWNLSQFLHACGRTDEAAELVDSYLQRHPGAVELAAERSSWIEPAMG